MDIINILIQVLVFIPVACIVLDIIYITGIEEFLIEELETLIVGRTQSVKYFEVSLSDLEPEPDVTPKALPQGKYSIGLFEEIALQIQREKESV